MFVSICTKYKLLHYVEDTLYNGIAMSKSEWKTICKKAIYRREEYIYGIEIIMYKKLSHLINTPIRMSIWWIVSYKFCYALQVCALLVKMTVGEDPLQNNCYVGKKDKICPLCNCDNETLDHFLFTCSFLKMSRHEFYLALKQVTANAELIIQNKNVTCIVLAQFDKILNDLHAFNLVQLAVSVHNMWKMREYLVNSK